MAAVGLLAVVGGVYALAGPPEAVHAEGGPIELLQLGFWYSALILLVAAAARGPTPMDRAGALWFYAVAGLATMREFDLHLWPRPENLGRWGMHFRTRWWLDFDVPLAPKLLWGIIGLLLLAALTVPLVRGARVIPRLIRNRDGAVMLFLISSLLCFGGFTTDDLMRHPEFVSEETLRGVEEVIELYAAAAYAGVGAALLAWPLSRRLESPEAVVIVPQRVATAPG